MVAAVFTDSTAWIVSCESANLTLAIVALAVAANNTR
jgi:hypothetical protein